MFFKKEIIKEVKVVDEAMVKKLEKEINYLEQKIKQSTLDFASEKRILEAELHIKVATAVSEKEKENNKLKEDNAVYKSKVEILEKAFENMGFDVKDMKEILNKLVDGIVSKNTINVVK